MTHFNKLVIALKIAAIILTLNVVQNLPAELANVEYIKGTIDSLTVLLTLVLPASIKLLVAALFWVFPKFLITSIVPDPQKSETSSEYFNHLYNSLIIAIGVYLIGVALSDLAYYLALKSEMQRQFASSLQPPEHAGLVATVAQIIIGVLLIIGSKTLTKILKLVRE